MWAEGLATMAYIMFWKQQFTGNRLYTGPVIEKYIEVMELAEGGGGIVIDNALEAESVFSRYWKTRRIRISCEACP